MSVALHHHLEFLQRLGHNVREVDGVHWFNVNRGVYTSLPYVRDLNPLQLDVPAILQRDGLVARFGCPVEQGVESFRVICSDVDYGFQSLRSRARTQVRRGLEACQVRRIDFTDLLKQAMPLNADTLTRQGRKVPSDLAAWWTRYYQSAAATSGAEAWAAFAGSSMAAYLISFTIDDTANLLIVRSSSSMLDLFPNNALIFEFLRQRLRIGDVSQISYGYESIQSELGSLDQFKTGMGFRKVPTGQRLELTAWLRPFVNRYTAPVAIRALQSLSRGETAAKLSGILRWYGQQPLLPVTRIPGRAA